MLERACLVFIFILFYFIFFLYIVNGLEGEVRKESLID